VQSLPSEYPAFPMLGAKLARHFSTKTRAR
jgi:hypothetical protein